MLRSRIGQFVEESRCRPVQLDEYIKLRASTLPNSGWTRTVSREGPLEVFDVMCSREDVVIEIEDLGVNRIVATVAGPWLRRREVSTIELLQIANDAIVEGRQATAADIVNQALQSFSSSLLRTQIFFPASALRVSVTPRSDEAVDQEVSIWIHAIQWVNV